jgi:hypothetical protein
LRVTLARMSTAFQIPEWLLQAPSPLPPVDDHRVEALVNRFIAGKQEALFTAPDAFYRLEGDDAVQGRPAIADRLQALRAATLDLARDDGERAALGPRLDLHVDDATDGIDRHVAEQRRVHQRQVVSERQALIQRAAELEHDNDHKIVALAEANASAARARARVDGIGPDSPEDAAAVLGARSSILRTAINERIANGKGAQALALFDRVKDQLAPADRQSLDAPVQAARYDQLTDQWIDRESKTDGPPLQKRLEADSSIPSDAKPIARAKLDARESAAESARAAKVQALDDEVRDAFRLLPANPDAYRLGTLARLADAYAAAGEPQKAAEAWQLALQEPFLRAFARVSPDRQQKLIDSLPAENRPAAEAIRRGQAETFAQDSAGHSTALNADDGAETERIIDALYADDGAGPASGPEDAKEARGLLHQVQDVRENARQGKAGEDAEVARLRRIDPKAHLVRQIRIYVEGGPSYMVADIIFRGNGTTTIIITEVKTGSGILTDNQVKALAKAARTGEVYITNAEALEKYGIEPNKTFGAQNIIPEVYVIGGDSAKIERQMRNQGLDVRPAGVRGRLRIGGPPM